MEKKERDALDGALEVIECIFDSYNAWIRDDESDNLSAVVNSLLELADVFIIDDKAREVVDLLRKTRDTSISLMREKRELNSKIHHE